MTTSTQVSPESGGSSGNIQSSSMNGQSKSELSSFIRSEVEREMRSQLELSSFIRSEVEREMRRFYENIFEELDVRIGTALGKVQPVGKTAEQGNSFQVLDGWHQLDDPMPWGKSNGKAMTYTALGQQPGAADVLMKETSGSIDEVMLFNESTTGPIDDAALLIVKDRELSPSQTQFMETWLALVESGQLDIYTCLGLSNAFTNTDDTRKIWAKAFSVATMQLVVPCIMIYAEVMHGMTIHPCVSDKGFRFIGAVLYTYSVYTMYNNANCACRSELSHMMAEYENVPTGFWLPLVVGELLNVVVAVILVITLYQIYTHQNEPADLILNAVAVNFLGSVDSEFVNEEMKIDAVANFKQLTRDLFKGPSSSGEDFDPDEESMTDHIIRFVLYGVALAGFAGAFVFMLTATAHDAEAQVHHGMRHAGIGKVTLRI